MFCIWGSDFNDLHDLLPEPVPAQPPGWRPNPQTSASRVATSPIVPVEARASESRPELAGRKGQDLVLPDATITASASWPLTNVAPSFS